MPTTATKIQPFGIANEHPRNQDIKLQCVPGCRLRGPVNAGAVTVDPRTGDEKIPRDQAIHLGNLPPIPGMEIHVNPDKLSYRVIDPLHDNEDLCARIKKGINAMGKFQTGGKIEGVPPQTGKLDVHRMKTLCRELLYLVDSGEVKIVKGAKPELEDIKGMLGKFLLNPGCTIPNGQPKFEEDYDEWCSSLSRSGG